VFLLLIFCIEYAKVARDCTLSLHVALPICEIVGVGGTECCGRCGRLGRVATGCGPAGSAAGGRGIVERAGVVSGSRGILRAGGRSEEHTSELQSRENLVCRLLLEKKNIV